MEGVALVDLQSANPSGMNAIGGFNGSSMVDYGAPLTFRFVTPAGEGTTDYFAITTDTSALSVNGNAVIVTAYDANDEVVGSTSFVEAGVGGVVVALRDIGAFSRIVVDPTLYDPSSGGIGFDLVEFGSVTGVPDNGGWVPSSSAILRCEEGIAKATAKLAGGLFSCHRRRVRAAVKGQPFDQEACENAARTKYDGIAMRLFAGGACPPCAVTNAPEIADHLQLTLDSDNGLLYCDGSVALP
jgi:hypothetical protein